MYILPSRSVRGPIDELIDEEEVEMGIYRENGFNRVVIYSGGYHVLREIIESGVTSKEFKTGYRELIKKKDDELIEEILANSTRKPIHMGYAIYIIREYLRRRSILTADVGGNEGWARDIIGVTREVRYLYASGFGTLGYSFPAALGAKVTGTDRDVISITGDGSLLMSIMELNTMSFYNIPAKIFVLNDSSYGILGYFSKRDFDREIETYIGVVDFAKVGDGMGVESIRVEEPRELDSVVKDVMNRNKPILVDIVTSKMDIPPLWRR